MLIFFRFLFLAVSTIIFVIAPLPGKIAERRHHPQAKKIRIAGWKAALKLNPSSWLKALKWALNKDKSKDKKKLKSDS